LKKTADFRLRQFLLVKLNLMMKKKLVKWQKMKRRRNAVRRNLRRSKLVKTPKKLNV